MELPKHELDELSPKGEEEGLYLILDGLAAADPGNEPGATDGKNCRVKNPVQVMAHKNRASKAT